MKVVIQRVSRASVIADGVFSGEIERGVLALVGINSGDDEKIMDFIIDKLVNLRIFEDENGKMNLSVKDINGGILIVPNFTVYADASHGRRPSFAGGARPEDAKKIFERFIEKAESAYGNIEKGVFRADMKVELLNDGPVTIILEKECDSL
ncbi:MAG: D-tyrosyl-tRNA(Tyr) deacylase [Firmicutes bacterium]|nr:D-tyrosyl-tRNA(Tyr) deacylase [Bacillota bacterium]